MLGREAIVDRHDHAARGVGEAAAEPSCVSRLHSTKPPPWKYTSPGSGAPRPVRRVDAHGDLAGGARDRPVLDLRDRPRARRRCAARAPCPRGSARGRASEKSGIGGHHVEQGLRLGVERHRAISFGRGGGGPDHTPRAKKARRHICALDHHATHRARLRRRRRRGAPSRRADRRAELASGGNAADAACAMGFALWVLEPTQNGPGGEVPILVRDARRDRVFAISGQGPAPAAATIERVRARGLRSAAARRAGLGLRARRARRVVPAARGVRHAPARRRDRARARARRARLPDVPVPARSDRADRAALRALVADERGDLPARARGRRAPDQSRRSRAGSRRCATRSARRADRARRGSAPRATRSTAARARRRSSASRAAGARRERTRARGPAHARDDLARYAGAVEEPLAVDYCGARVCKTGPWGQGPVFLQQLRLLEGFDLAALDPGGADALHLWLETAKLAFADRDACYGDPRFADVPIDDAALARLRRAAPRAGRPREGVARAAARDRAAARGLAARRGGRARAAGRAAARSRAASRGPRPTPRSVSRSTPRATPCRPRRAAAGS